MNKKPLFLISIVLCGLLSISSIYATDNVNSDNDQSVTVLDSNVGGDVLKNPSINKYMSKTSFNLDLINKLKTGSVVYRFGDGSGKKVLICAGIHGDEPQANLATLKFMDFLKGKQIKGTIYIIPFAMPCDTALNTRYYNGSDPNRQATVSGSPANNILKFARDNNIDYLMDVHAGTGVGSTGLVFYQNSFEKAWGTYVNSKTKCIVMSKPNEGTLRTTATSQGINAITLEVDKKYSLDTTIATELNLIKYSAQYLGLITIPTPPPKPDLTIKSAKKLSRYVYVTVSYKNLKKGQKIALKYRYRKYAGIFYFKTKSTSATQTLKVYFPYKKGELWLDPKNAIKESNEKNNYLKFGYRR